MGSVGSSDVTGPLGAIQRWVIKQIAKAAGLIENDISKAADYVAGRFGGIENTISHLAGEMNHIVASAGGDVSRLWDHARKDVDGWIHDAIGDALAVKGAIWNDLKSWGHDAEHYTDNAVSAFHRDVLRPVENGLHAAIHDAEHVAEDAWHVWYKDIWGPADKIIHDAEHDAHKAVYWIDHSGLDAVHLVEKCWDFLEWVALNPARALESLPRKALAELTTGKLSGDADTITSGWSGLVTELEKVFPDD